MSPREIANVRAGDRFRDAEGVTWKATLDARPETVGATTWQTYLVSASGGQSMRLSHRTCSGLVQVPQSDAKLLQFPA